VAWLGDRKGRKPKKKQVVVRENPPTGKYPFAREYPTTGKTPRIPFAPDTGDSLPSWRFRTLDIDGPFCPTRMTPAEVREVRSKLGNFESMTWAEIERGGSHSIAVSELEKPARERLEHLQLDDIEEVFSLRLSGKERVFGLRQGAVMRLLWWDPDHEVCPAPLKHT
jgi:hypothetical protein